MNVSSFLTEKIADGAAALAIENEVAAISAGYHQEHNANDTHKTINASGTIAERKRTTPMGVWINIPYYDNSLTFGTDAGGGATFAVSVTQMTYLKYMLIGTTMTVSWLFTNAVIGTAVASSVYFTLPKALYIRVSQFNSFPYNDNGTGGTGAAMTSTRTNGQVAITLFKDAAAVGTFSVSAALTLAGQISFEVFGI